MTATAIIRGFEIEALAVFAIVGAKMWRDTRAAGRLTPLGALFVGGLAVVLVGNPIANWGLQRHLLPAAARLRPRAVAGAVFAYPWCFPMLAYAGRRLARACGGRSALAGFAGGCLTGGVTFVLSVPMTDVFGVTTFIGLFAAVLMPAPGAPRSRRRCWSGSSC